MDVGLETIEVGKQSGTDTVFIAVSDKQYDKIEAPLSGRILHAIRIENNDVEWLIEALAKEIGYERAQCAIERCKE